MIDFVKLRPKQPALASQLRPDARFTWTDHINSNGQKTGVKASIHALTWYVANSGFIEITGSLHKCWNSINDRPAENWNDFSLPSLTEVLDWLTYEFGVDPATTTVHNIEFGVNLILPPAPPTVRDLLSKLLFYGSAKPFTEMPVKRGYYKRQDSNDFYVKAYDKGTQYATPDQRLRFEKGVTAMKNINDDSPIVVTLADLNNSTRLDQLGALLLTTFDRCFWAEDFSRINLTNTQQQTVANAHNVAYVASLTHTQRSRLKDDYDHIANQLDHRLSTYIRAQIKTKWSDLLGVDCKVLQRGAVKGITRLENVVKPYTTSTTAIEQSSERTVRVEGNSRNRAVIETPAAPKANTLFSGLKLSTSFPPTNTEPGAVTCPITGVPIPSASKTGKGKQRFVSATMLRIDDDLLTELDIVFKQYAKGSKEDDYSRVAHNVRNAYHNPINNLRTGIIRRLKQPTLFPLSDTLRLNEDQRRIVDSWKGTQWELPI